MPARIDGDIGGLEDPVDAQPKVSPDFPRGFSRSPTQPLRGREAVETSEERVFTAPRSATAMQLPPVRERRSLWSWLMLILGLLIGLAGTGYFAFIATGRYVTEVHLTVRDSDLAQAGNLASTSIFGLGNTTGAAYADSFVVAEYLRSPAAVHDVQNKLNLRRMFSGRWIDPLSRFAANGDEEQLNKYWQHRVLVDYDPITATVTMTVEAFTAEDSLALANAALASAGSLVNRMDNQARGDVLKFAQSDLDQTQKKLLAIEAELAHPATTSQEQVQQLQVDQDFAQKDYENALQQMETAKSIATITQRYLVVYVPPLLATSSTQPIRWQSILIVWLAVIMVGGILALFVATIREHLL